MLKGTFLRCSRPTPACRWPHSLPVVASLSSQGESATSKELLVWQPLWLSYVQPFQDVGGSVGSLTRDSLFHDLFNQMNFCVYVIHVHWHFCRALRWTGPRGKSVNSISMSDRCSWFQSNDFNLIWKVCVSSVVRLLHNPASEDQYVLSYLLYRICIVNWS